MRKFVIFAVVMFTIIALFACDKNGDKDFDNIKIKLTNEQDEMAIKLSGFVGDLEYNKLKNFEILFGENIEYSVMTDEKGNFSFYYYDPYEYPADKIIDFIHINSQEYIYRIFLSPNQGLEYFEQINCIIVIGDKTQQDDIKDVEGSLLIRCSFDQSGIVLPTGYPSFTKELDEQSYSIEGRSTMTGVKLYVNGKYYLESEIRGFEMPYIIPQTELRLEYSGFNFKLRFGQSQPFELENNTYLYTGNEPASLEFRGYTDDVQALLTT